MINKDKLKSTLGEIAELKKDNSFDIDLEEMAVKLKCSPMEVLSGLELLQAADEIKRLKPVGLSKYGYTLTIKEKSSMYFRRRNC